MPKTHHTKRRRWPKGWVVDPATVDRLVEDATQAVLSRDYAGALEIGQRVLRLAPTGSEQRLFGLRYTAAALAMLQRYAEAYPYLLQALDQAPDEIDLLRNMANVCLYTTRLGKALAYLQRARVVAEGTEFAAEVQKTLDFASNSVDEELALRPPGFTLEQLIEQQEAFVAGVDLMTARKWEQAGATFRKVIALGEAHPQPWANLGVCLMMLNRVEEAEQALARAIEIDPKYETARTNLDLLKQSVAAGVSPVSEHTRLAINDPLAGRDASKDHLTVYAPHERDEPPASDS